MIKLPDCAVEQMETPIATPTLRTLVSQGDELTSHARADNEPGSRSLEEAQADRERINPREHCSVRLHPGSQMNGLDPNRTRVLDGHG